MPKSPCPPGQTRNRVTKACRDKKKPGRRPGTRKAAEPKAKKLLFEVFLINNELDNANESDTAHDMFKRMQNKYKNDDAPASKQVANNAAKIIKWYKQFKDDYRDYMLEIKGIKHKHGNVFELQYIGDDDFAVDSYLDHDDDGNYPITINGINYLISGERIFDDDE